MHEDGKGQTLWHCEFDAFVACAAQRFDGFEHRPLVRGRRFDIVVCASPVSSHTPSFITDTPHKNIKRKSGWAHVETAAKSREMHCTRYGARPRRLLPRECPTPRMGTRPERGDHEGEKRKRRRGDLRL